MSEINRKIWLNGKIIPVEKAKINILSPTAQFGANVFEGIRCYWSEENNQLYAFRLKEHYERLDCSIKLLRLKSQYTHEDFKKALIDIVVANKYKEDIAVRQTVFVDGENGSWSSSEPISMFVAPIPKKKIDINANTGLRCCISSWERISDRNLSPRAKVGANYINSRMAYLDAVEKGYDTAVILNNIGRISEGPGSCIFIVRKGVLITPPFTASVLESITRDTIIQLAVNTLNIPIEVRDVDRTELYISDEAFLCGSAMEINYISEIDGYNIGNGLLGNITRRIHELYQRIVIGEIDRYRSWLTPIY